jgi:23S rRNA G2445 N2-methylase RlmL
MLRLAQLPPGARLLDPCCGSGTIPIEAALAGFEASGSDLDPEAVAGARLNAQAAGLTLALETWDARALPLEPASFDAMITNLPWGKQIAVDDALDRLYAEICAEIERVLRPGGRAVILTSTPDLVRFASLPLSSSLEISLFGQTPTICMFG